MDRGQLAGEQLSSSVIVKLFHRVLLTRNKLMFKQCFFLYIFDCIWVLVLFRERRINVSIKGIPWTLYMNNRYNCKCHCWTQEEIRRKIFESIVHQYCRSTQGLPEIKYRVGVWGAIMFTNISCECDCSYFSVCLKAPQQLTCVYHLPYHVIIPIYNQRFHQFSMA